jgi:hypothetical protein
MKLIIESTTLVTEMNGMPARIWEGKTDSGIPVHCYVTRVAVARDADCAEFERELQECTEPSPAVSRAISIGMII